MGQILEGRGAPLFIACWSTDSMCYRRPRVKTAFQMKKIMVINKNTKSKIKGHQKITLHFLELA